MWMGVYRETIDSTQFVTAEGEVVPNDLIYWETGEPDFGVDQYLLLYIRPGAKMGYLHDTLEHDTNGYLCDLK